jgi:SAM-dependent methyltransferase
MHRTGVKTFVNLGCGSPGSGHPVNLFEGWRELRVDVTADVQPDIQASMTDLSAIASNSIDGVWCSHAIEHLYRHEVAVALAEIYRILSPEGVACIRVPDLQAIASLIAEDRLLEPIYTAEAGPVCAHDILYGFGPQVAKGHTNMAHRSGFTPSALVASLRQAAFGQFLVMKLDNLEIVGLAHKTTWRDEAERRAMAEKIRS